jgi:hypothetical protein
MRDTQSDCCSLNARAGSNGFVGIRQSNRQTAQLRHNMAVCRAARPAADQPNRIQRGLSPEGIQCIE